MNKSARFLPALIALISVAALAQSGAVGGGRPTQGYNGSALLQYRVELLDPAQHMVRVSVLPIAYADRPEVDLQLPVWNALYQVRDFAQYVQWVRATARTGQTVPVRKLDKSTWRVPSGAWIEYAITLDLRGPFGAQFNANHAFFNLAELLMYPLGQRNVPITVTFSNIPSGWRVATSLRSTSTDSGRAVFTAPNYDALVDSPVEIGNFREVSFQEGRATYRIVADGNPEDYDLNAIAASVRKIVAAAVDWMQDCPFDGYTFIYHLPRGPAGGGMEHAYSTAIDVSADALRRGLGSLENVTAHEFFHLWNVKRIRPTSLEPVDYTKENYTRALWFSEGVDSAVTQYILLNAGLTDEKRFLQHFAGQIRELERRPAHLTQSVEESSLDAWLEKYSPYNQPQRSVNYYNKGELLGFLLDLAVRQASNDRASLRKVFQRMNQHYAKQGRFFPDSAGVQEAAEAVSGAKLDSFFRKYVAGVEELPYDDLLKTVGLRLERKQVSVAALGFGLAFGSEGATVASVDEGEAQRAGLREGDVVVSINGQPTSGRSSRTALADLKPGDPLSVKIRRPQGETELQFKAGSRDEEQFSIVDLDGVTADQRARRALWLSSRVAGAAQSPSAVQAGAVR